MNKITIETETNLIHIMVISAFRYALGRMSYIPSMVCEFITKQWSVLPDNTKQILIRELSEQVKRNDEQKNDDNFCSLLGHECDVVEWKKLLKFMKENTLL